MAESRRCRTLRLGPLAGVVKEALLGSYDMASPEPRWRARA